MSDVLAHSRSSLTDVFKSCMQFAGNIACDILLDLRQRSPAQLLKLYLKFAGLQALGQVGWSSAKRLRMSMLLRNVPKHKGPTSMLFGSIPRFAGENRYRTHDVWNELSQGLPICRLRGFFWQSDFVWLAVRDPKLLEHIMKDCFEDVTRPDPASDYAHDIFRRWLGKGIFTLRHGRGAPVENSIWWQQRKTAAAVFSKVNFSTNMAQVFSKKVEVIRQRLVPDKPIDMQRLFFDFSLDSIMEIFFGEESNVLGGGDNVIGKSHDCAGRNMFEILWKSSVPRIVASLLPWPWGGKCGIFMNTYASMNPSHRAFASSVAKLDEEMDRIVTKARADPLLPKRRDMLALFLQENEKQGLSRSASDSYMREFCKSITVGGRDTTACTLSWMFYELATNLDLQQRVVEEVLQRVPPGMTPTVNDLHHANMPLLNAMLYETLRLHPAAPTTIKAPTVDVVLPNGQKIPKGTNIRVCIWQMGRDPKLYDEPEKVKLERWIPFKKPDPYHFPVFGAGLRTCLGQEMGIFEAKFVTCLLLQEFSFTLLKGEQEKTTYSLGLTMCVQNSKKAESHNLWLIPHRRDVKKE